MFSLPVEFLRFNRLALRVSRYSQVHNSAAWKNDDQKLRVKSRGKACAGWTVAIGQGSGPMTD